MSLLPLAGMFIFGGKKEKKKRTEEKKPKLPKSVVSAIASFHASANKGYIKLVAEADPERNENRVIKILDAEQKYREGYVYISALRQKKYQNVGMLAKFEDRPPRGLPVVHGFLALLVSHHSGKVLPEIGHAVGDAIDRYYFGGERERDISDIKKNPGEFAALVARELKENNIVTDEEKAKQAILRGLPTIIRIAEKLWPENHDPEHLEKASNAFDEGVEDPIHILKQTGIDIEPELEELRQILLEVSGKKPKAAKKGRKKTETQKSKTTAPSQSLTLVAHELLGLLSGLRLAGYSEGALENLRRELEKRIDGLIENPGENLELIGLYTAVLKLAEKGEIEKAEEFLRSL